MRFTSELKICSGSPVQRHPQVYSQLSNDILLLKIGQEMKM